MTFPRSSRKEGVILMLLGSQDTDRQRSCCPLLEAKPEASSEASEGAGRGGRIDTNPCHSLHWTLHVTLIHFP